MKDELLERLEALSAQTNRSRNELINLLLNAAIDIVHVEEEYRHPHEFRRRTRNPVGADDLSARQNAVPKRENLWKSRMP